ncbi:MAG: hypothetical protein QOD83_1417 [Solirubrobacteraceae bacterium]|nr:hypothetical protein [Solirubrobacteraceae bacterium]
MERHAGGAPTPGAVDKARLSAAYRRRRRRSAVSTGRSRRQARRACRRPATSPGSGGCGDCAFREPIPLEAGLRRDHPAVALARASTHRLLTAGLLGRSRAVSSPLAGCACSCTPATRPHPESARETQFVDDSWGIVGSGNLTAEIAGAMRVVERMDNGSLLVFADRADLDAKPRSQCAPRGGLGLSRRSTRKRRWPSPRAARTRSATSSPQAARSGETPSPSPS